MFVNKHQGLKALGGRLEEQWNSRDSMIAKIRKDFGCPISVNASRIESVLLKVVLCFTNGTKFDPQAIEQRGRKRSPTFSLDSEEA